MKRIIIGATDYTPSLDLDPNKLQLVIQGVSRPENVGLFYQQILDWVGELLLEADNIKDSAVKLLMKLDYCNSASQKYLLLLIEKLMEFEDKNVKLEIEWHYDEADEKMLEDGEDISDAVGHEFKYVSFK